LPGFWWWADFGGIVIVSIFDCDGTLYSAQFGRGLLRYVGSRGFKSRVRAYYASLLPRYLLRKFHLIPEEDLNRPAIANLGRLIAGWDVDMGAAAFEWVACEYLLPSKRKHVLARLEKHQANQHLVVLLSGVFVPCLELIGSELGVADLVGTRIGVKDGKYSGDILPPVITGKDKLPKVQKFFADRDLNVDWKASYAYADSIHDIPVLGAVGNPVVVHPDPDLLALARERSWEVIGSD
jgi:HAD superfamily hydrolase (TIGR01490 family)